MRKVWIGCPCFILGWDLFLNVLFFCHPSGCNSLVFSHSQHAYGINKNVCRLISLKLTHTQFYLHLLKQILLLIIIHPLGMKSFFSENLYYMVILFFNKLNKRVEVHWHREIQNVECYWLFFFFFFFFKSYLFVLELRERASTWAGNGQRER